VTLTSTPSSSPSSSAAFAWLTAGVVTSTTCSLDGGPEAACASPRTVSGLAPGTHTFRVRVANAGGVSTATHSWTVLAPGSPPPPPPPPGPPPPPPPPTRQPAVGSMSLSPRTPRAGRSATLKVVLSVPSPTAVLTGGKVSCTARAGRKRLRASLAGFLPVSSTGTLAARCAWRLPPGTRGSMLRASIQVRAEGLALGRSVAKRIR
jgi:hypothetical protein